MSDSAGQNLSYRSPGDRNDLLAEYLLAFAHWSYFSIIWEAEKSCWTLASWWAGEGPIKSVSRVPWRLLENFRGRIRYRIASTFERPCRSHRKWEIRTIDQIRVMHQSCTMLRDLGPILRRWRKRPRITETYLVLVLKEDYRSVILRVHAMNSDFPKSYSVSNCMRRFIFLDVQFQENKQKPVNSASQLAMDPNRRLIMFTITKSVVRFPRNICLSKYSKRKAISYETTMLRIGPLECAESSVEMYLWFDIVVKHGWFPRKFSLISSRE